LSLRRLPALSLWAAASWFAALPAAAAGPTTLALDGLQPGQPLAAARQALQARLPHCPVVQTAFADGSVDSLSVRARLDDADQPARCTSAAQAAGRDDEYEVGFTHPGATGSATAFVVIRRRLFPAACPPSQPCPAVGAVEEDLARRHGRPSLRRVDADPGGATMAAGSAGAAPTYTLLLRWSERGGAAALCNRRACGDRWVQAVIHVRGNPREPRAADPASAVVVSATDGVLAQKQNTWLAANPAARPVK
jgi:hypothetical protein